MGCDILHKVNLTKGKEGASDLEKRMILLGLDNAGKTSLLFQIRDHEFKTTVPTIGLNIEQVMYKNHTFTFWDVGGQATKLWKHYFDSIDAVVFVIDSTDDTRLMFVHDELHAVSQDAALKGVPFLIYLNKRDLVDKALSTELIVSKLELDQIEQEYVVQDCSAMTAEGIWEGIDQLLTVTQDIEKNSQTMSADDRSTKKETKTSENHS